MAESHHLGEEPVKKQLIMENILRYCICIEGKKEQRFNFIYNFSAVG